MPAAIENDVRLAAIGESWLGTARGIPDFVFLAIGTASPPVYSPMAGWFMVQTRPPARSATCMFREHHWSPQSRAHRDPWKARLAARASASNGCGRWNRQRLRPRGDRDRDSRKRLRRGCSCRGRTQPFSASSCLCRLQHVTRLEQLPFRAGRGSRNERVFAHTTQRNLEQYHEPAPPKVIVSSLGQDAQLIGAIRLALDKAEERIGLKL